MHIRKILSLLLGTLFLLSFVYSGAQSSEDLIKQAKAYTETDQLEAAKAAYLSVAGDQDPGNRLLAFSGLVKLAVLESNLVAADSLLLLGDQLLQSHDVSANSLGVFKIIKGLFFGRNSQFPEALAAYQEAATISKDLEDGWLVHADALFNAGLVFERTGLYDSSLVYLKRAFPIYQANLDTTSLKFAGIYNGFGNTYYRLSQFAEAKAYYLKSRNLAENQLGPVSSDLAIALGNLSAISRAEGDYKQAVQYSEHALKIHRALNDESGVSSDYYALGIYHYFMGDYGRAKDYIESCIVLREKLFNETHYSLIDPYQVLGIVSEESGDYQKDLDYLQKARPVITANF